MNAKIIGVLVCIFVIVSSELPAMATSIAQNISIDEVARYTALNNDGNETRMGFWTYGPIRFISRFTLLNGSTTDLLKIRFIFRKNLLPRLLPSNYVMIFDGNLDFTVEYKRSLILGNLSAFMYWTSFGEFADGNMTNRTEFFNVKHAVRVEGFTGVIGVIHRFLYMPEHFVIVGTCENVTLIPLS